jgi:putative phosphoserine phosphatase/1-acylglycerol-3-phosphate O-acyltransferase
VFLFNHRNNFDIFIVAALVKDNWTGVAKKELESNPLVGPLGKLMDAAFIDRADTASAVAALAPIEEAARKGLSIVIAPEGPGWTPSRSARSRRAPSGSRWRPACRSSRS